ncbi:Bromodomain-containing protein [Echria macrotheca]|uniref:Bromodomain-containing protein n=1 Tax=Echria macrotheca TaxID=438768 RepID=A0AAJ0BA06_9PEZI|nr:Bromodomain-containing protein [Echria macrotheca]
MAEETEVNGAKSTPEAATTENMTVPVPDTPPFSWLDPHPLFVIVLVGPDETPYGIQKDFLCAKSTFYRKYFAENSSDTVEHLVRLPDTPLEVFAFAQNFLFTGRVSPSLDKLPTYEILIGVWKLGHDLGIEGLCDATLDAMTECRRATQHIPAPPLLVRVWQDTPEGSSIRKLLLSWAAEYMRSSESRAEFARSLPQEVLSELVVAMSSLDSAPPAPASPPSTLAPQRRGIQHVEDNDTSDVQLPPLKKARYSDVLPSNTAPPPTKVANKKPVGRPSLGATKQVQKRRSLAVSSDHQITTSQKIDFCRDLLYRMLSGPGFWTRLVGPFKEPVDPVSDGVPDYLDKVKRPMDLGTMKAKMDRHEYHDENEFLVDMNQIFTNCYTYWSKDDPMWAACERLQKTFEDKYAQMNKWIAKMEGEEEH